MLLSKRCTYGLRLALYLTARPFGAYVPIGDVSTALGMPPAFLSKTAQSLIAAGLLASSRGPHGGIRLAQPPSSTRLLSIVEALDGPALFEACVLGLPGCGHRRPCPLHDPWVAAREQLRALFDETTLADLGARIQTEGLRLEDLPDQA